MQIFDMDFVFFSELLNCQPGTTGCCVACFLLAVVVCTWTLLDSRGRFMPADMKWSYYELCLHGIRTLYSVR